MLFSKYEKRIFIRCGTFSSGCNTGSVGGKSWDSFVQWFHIEKAKQSATSNLFTQVTKYIELELLKCNTGFELEAYEKFMSNRQKYSGLVLTSCETYFGDPYENNRQKFDAISGQIINYLLGYSGEEKRI